MHFRSRSRPLAEKLESRRLLSGGDPTSGYALPISLDFNKPAGGVTDQAGRGTGFTWVQPNRLGSGYDSSKVVLKPGAGLLRLYATGADADTTNYEAVNDLSNVLNLRFSASSKPFVISTRLNGPFPQLTTSAQQGGIIFGPDEDDYVKLVVGVTAGGTGLEFLDEQKFKTGYRHSLSPEITDIGSLTSIQTLDLYLSCDPKSDTVRALYRINGGDVIQLGQTLTLKGDKASAFFSNAGYSGIMQVQNDNTGPGSR